MSRKRVSAEAPEGEALDRIKRAGIVAMVSDDDLMEKLVLKGGNAMDIVHRISSRASIDLDFSMRDDFNLEDVQPKIENALKSTFDHEGYFAFDVRLSIRPGKLPEELSAFWGGYLVEFKLISKQRAKEARYDFEIMRREAVRLGQGTKFTIDISRYEYVEDKVECELDGYRVFVYSPEMIVCEKLRAICQQMPQYGEVIQRTSLGNQRARDFVDIEVLVRQCRVDLKTDRAKHIVSEMFAMKRVPIGYLGLVSSTRQFHELGFEGVKAAIKPGVQINSFDYYFDFVVNECDKLESLWNVEPPAPDV